MTRIAEALERIAVALEGILVRLEAWDTNDRLDVRVQGAVGTYKEE